MTNITFKDGTYIVDNRTTFQVRTFRAFLRKDLKQIHLRYFSGKLLAIIKDDVTLNGATVTLDELFKFFITHG